MTESSSLIVRLGVAIIVFLVIGWSISDSLDRERRAVVCEMVVEESLREGCD